MLDLKRDYFPLFSCDFTFASCQPTVVGQVTYFWQTVLLPTSSFYPHFYCVPVVQVSSSLSVILLIAFFSYIALFLSRSLDIFDFFFSSACIYHSKPSLFSSLFLFFLHFSLPLSLCYSYPMSPMPHNNKIASCDTACVPAP